MSHTKHFACLFVTIFVYMFIQNKLLYSKIFSNPNCWYMELKSSFVLSCHFKGYQGKTVLMESCQKYIKFSSRKLIIN